MGSAVIASQLDAGNLPSLFFPRSVQWAQMSPPLLWKSSVFQASSKGLFAWDKKTGRKLWFFPVKNGVSSRLATLKERLFFAGNDGNFYALNTKDGRVIWRVPVQVESVIYPTLHQGMIYFITAKDVLYALSAANGSQQWTYSRIGVSPAMALLGTCAPRVHKGLVYACFSSGHLVVIDAKTGQFKWQLAFPSDSIAAHVFQDMDSFPLIESHHIYIGSYVGGVRSLQLKSGRELWIHGNINDERQKVAVVRKGKGGTTAAATEAGVGAYGGFAQHLNTLYYASSKGQLIALDKFRGHKKWSLEVLGGLFTTPVVYKDFVVAGHSKEGLYFVHRESGKVKLHWKGGAGIFAEPVLDETNKTLFLATKGSYLYAFKIHDKYPYLKSSFQGFFKKRVADGSDGVIYVH